MNFVTHVSFKIYAKVIHHVSMEEFVYLDQVLMNTAVIVVKQITSEQTAVR